jgi:hypothetical protein
MNDDNKIVNQKTSPVVQADQATPQVQVQPVAPVGSTNKEVGPVNALAPEFVKSSEVEPQIDQDLKELGVEAKKEKPDLTFEHKKVGIEHAGPHIAVSTVPSGKVTLPMSEEEIMDKLKTGQDDDSSKWLAGLINKVIAVMGFRSN